MALRSGEKKFVLVAAATLIVVGAVVGALLAVLTPRDAAPESHIQVTTAAGMQRVAPSADCGLRFERCTAAAQIEIGDPARVPVHPGGTLWLSVPKLVYEAPWTLIVQYQNADGTFEMPEERTFRPRTSFTVLLHSTNERRLSTIEIHTPAAIDFGGRFGVDKLWHLNALPDEFLPAV